MLRLMRESDTPPATFGEALKEVCQQRGQTTEESAASVQVLEFDGGTFANFNGLRSQRFPSLDAYSSLQNVVGILGVTHAGWAVYAAGVREYEGKGWSKDDPPLVSKMNRVLGRKAFDFRRIRDYNALERLVCDHFHLSALELAR